MLSRAIACDLYQGARLTQFMSLLMTINSLAPILGPICGSLIATHFDWPALFLFLALWGSLLLLASFKAIDETLPPNKRSPQIKEAIFDLGRELKNPPFMCLALALSLISGAFFGYLAASPFIFQEIFGLTPFEYSLVFGLNAVCVTVGANAAAWLARRIPERKIALASIVLLLLAHRDYLEAPQFLLGGGEPSALYRDEWRGTKHRLYRGDGTTPGRRGRSHRLVWRAHLLIWRLDRAFSRPHG